MYASKARRTTSEIVSERLSAVALASRQSSSLTRIARGVVPLDIGNHVRPELHCFLGRNPSGASSAVRAELDTERHMRLSKGKPSHVGRDASGRCNLSHDGERRHGGSRGDCLLDGLGFDAGGDVHFGFLCSGPALLMDQTYSGVYTPVNTKGKQNDY